MSRSRQRGLRFVLVLMVAVIAASVLAFAAPAQAAGTTRITIHARICPLSGVDDLFEDCHDNPMTGQAFRVTGRSSKYVNASGNVSFNELAPGSYVVALSAGDQPNEFLQLRAFCSDVNSGGAAYEVLVRSTAQASFRVNAWAGQHLVCDVYYIPESGQ